MGISENVKKQQFHYSNSIVGTLSTLTIRNDKLAVQMTHTHNKTTDGVAYSVEVP